MRLFIDNAFNLYKGDIFVRIGIAYDTKDMYDTTDKLHFDFADNDSILILKKELERLGYEVVLLGNAYNIMQLIKKDQLQCDIVYNTVEGIVSRNREGIIPALLEINHIPYIGTDSYGLSLTLDKYMTKILAGYHNIKTPPYCYIRYPQTEHSIEAALCKLEFPVIIKPNYEGNSSGISLCHDMNDAIQQISLLLKQYQTDVLCEQFIYGKEITVPYIDSSPEKLWDVTTIDVQRSSDFWLDTKWKTQGDYNNIILDVDHNIKSQFEYAVNTLFRAIGCRDFCRFDFRLTADNQIYFLEANPLPSLFCGGSFDVVGRQHGYTYGQTIQLIIETALKRLSIPKI